MEKKILLVGQMVASTRGFEPLVGELSKRGYEVAAYLPAGRPLTDMRKNIIEDARTADFVLTGMSSEEKLAEEEVVALEMAIARKIPRGVYADTFGVHRRTWFKHLREKIDFLFVTNEEEAWDAKTVYPSTKIIVSGNPSREAYFSPVWTYGESRFILGISSNEYVVLCPLGKDLDVNREHIGMVMASLDFIDSKFRLFICLHPGDLNPVEAYCDFLKPLTSSVNVAIINKNIMRSSVLVPPADIVIESGSDIGVEACCQRKPVISFWSKLALERTSAQKETPKWPPCEFGAQRAVYGNGDDLTVAINHLLFRRGYESMRERQEKLFPKPAEKGSAIKIMADTIGRYS